MIITAQEAAEKIKEFDRIMFGGFIACGCPERIVDALCKAGTRNLHCIGISADRENKGVGKLISNGQIVSMEASHIGTNPKAQQRYGSGDLKIDFIPQGTLIERIRAKGAGLGGILTPVGLNTIIEKGKQKIVVDGKEFLLEKPIQAHWGCIKAARADIYGNLVYSKTARNSNPVIASSADKVIAEVDEIVEAGRLDPENIVTPGIYVDFIVKPE